MAYEVAANLVAILHFAFLAFVVFGVALGRRSRIWRAVHIAAMLYGVAIEVFYWICPLTSLEQYLRQQAGRGSYEEPFIAHYLNKIIYLEVSQGALIIAALAVLGLNGGYYLYRWRHPQPLPS
ncbi:MAG TPA: DUF2784 domain-containing protein [Terriglobia bacterium]|nr:DUF2784 domain-containing protein [Terriglobia bacterium]